MTSPGSAYVLYVDDEPANLRVFEGNFGRSFDILTATSGEEGMAILRRHGPDIAVVVTDQRMPGMSGVEFLEKAQLIAPQAVRMVVTAYSDLEAVIAAVNRGQISHHFLKPWDREQLGRALADSVRIVTLGRRLQHVETRFLQASGLLTIGQTTAGIAHELVGPVAYVTQNVEVLRAQFATLRDYVRRVLPKYPDQTVEEALTVFPESLQDIETGAGHLLELARNIKGTARREDVESECDLAAVVHFAVKLARAEVAGTAKLQEAGSSVMVRCGPVRLTQVFLNLIVNAGHAVESAGRPGLIDISWRETPDGKVVAMVRDNGSGIPEEIRGRLFEPLFTTKPAGVGTGLGLSVSRDSMLGVGGDLRFTTETGVGTCFEVIVPKVGTKP
jgi:two-component system, NtrC family, sensor kinase